MDQYFYYLLPTFLYIYLIKVMGAFKSSGITEIFKPPGIAEFLNYWE